MKEQFKRLEEFPDYDIGNQGTIISRKYVKPRVLKGKYDKDGYKEYQLRDKEGNRKYRRGHRLVGFAWLGDPPEESYVINHKNGIKDDNRIENLEWATISENTLHAFRELGREPNRNGGIKTAIYTKEHELVGIFEYSTEAAKFLGVSVANLCKNRSNNDEGKRHNKGCGIYLIKKKYYCKTISEESVETIEKVVSIA